MSIELLRFFTFQPDGVILLILSLADQPYRIAAVLPDGNHRAQSGFAQGVHWMGNTMLGAVQMFIASHISANTYSPVRNKVYKLGTKW